jgi:5-methylcytosine-specific restriction endonuclease McrA
MTEEQILKNRARVRAWQKKNPERVKAKIMAWKRANPEKVRADHSRYYAGNQHEYLAHVGATRARRCGAATEKAGTEEWRAMVALYAKCAQITAETGNKHHVDHIVPLFCGGGHVLANLQILSAEEHFQKNAADRRFYKRARAECHAL